VFIAAEKLIEQGLKDETLFLVNQDNWSRIALIAQMQAVNSPVKPAPRITVD